MIWTSPDGRVWEVVDFIRPNQEPTARAKRVPLGHHDAEGRAFIPHGWEGPTYLYDFGRVAYRDTTDRILRSQLEFAYEAGSTPAERMQRRYRSQ